MSRKALALLGLLLLLSGCESKNKIDPELSGMTEVGLKVKGKSVFTYTEGSTQLSFNRSLRQFRAGNDDMTSFFVITCDQLPTGEGQQVKADVQWTSGSSVKTTTGLTFEVEKYESTGLVWLWNASDKTGAVVKILN
ncbi:MAG: hypothetical protein IJ156_02035 [Bacteroidales bacterium]|nr:hypothetical protein [Bacteroidales bacterium]